MWYDNARDTHRVSLVLQEHLRHWRGFWLLEAALVTGATTASKPLSIIIIITGYIKSAAASWSASVSQGGKNSKQQHLLDGSQCDGLG